MKQEFETRLSTKGPKGAWTFLPVAIGVSRSFGSRGRIAVAGTEERSVDLPKDIVAVVRQSRQPSSFFDSLSYSQKKEYVDWVVSAKLEPTRIKRLSKAVQMLAAGQKRLR